MMAEEMMVKVEVKVEAKLSEWEEPDKPRTERTKNGGDVKRHRSRSRSPKRSKREDRRDEGEPHRRSRRDEDEPRRSRRDDDEPRRSRRDDDEPRRSRRDEDEPRRSRRDDDRKRDDDRHHRRDDSPHRRSRNDESPHRRSRNKSPKAPKLDDLPILNKIYEGTVTGVKDFGVFVSLKGIKGKAEGLAHISNLMTTRVTHPSDVVSRGDLVKVCTRWC